MLRRRFLEILGIGTTAVALAPTKEILTGSSTSVAPEAAAAVTQQAAPASVSANQIMRVLANAKAGLDQGFPPDMTIQELLGKAPVAKTTEQTKSKASSSSGNDEALRKAQIGRILAAIATPAQRLSGQIQSTANKAA